MEELVANVGIPRPVAEKSVGNIFDVLRKECPADNVQALIGMLSRPRRFKAVRMKAQAPCSAWG